MVAITKCCIVVAADRAVGTIQRLFCVVLIMTHVLIQGLNEDVASLVPAALEGWPKMSAFILRGGISDAKSSSAQSRESALHYRLLPMKSRSSAGH